MENAAFAAFVKYGGVLLAKLVAMSPLTAYYRITRKSFASREDAVNIAGEDKDMVKRLLEKNTDVERVRAAHLNDLENIVPFFMISMLYVATKPDAATASLMFKIFTIARYLYTIVYVGKVRQPARGLAFFAGAIVNVYMLVKIISHTW